MVKIGNGGAGPGSNSSLMIASMAAFTAQTISISCVPSM
jgi:hypothetical protein